MKPSDILDAIKSSFELVAVGAGASGEDVVVIWADDGQPYHATVIVRLNVVSFAKEQDPRTTDDETSEGDPTIHVDQSTVYRIEAIFEGLENPASALNVADRVLALFALPSIEASQAAAGIALVDIPTEASYTPREIHGRVLNVWTINSEWRGVTTHIILESRGEIDSVELIGTLTTEQGDVTITDTVGDT
jgi:hypothetical protein